jgi:hypothetical protein
MRGFRLLTFPLYLYAVFPLIMDDLVDKVEEEVDRFAIWLRRRKMKE